LSAARTRLAAGVLAAATLGLACDPNAMTSGGGVDGGPGEGKGGNCVTCHLAEYEHADPPHVDVKPTTCAVCHVQEGWHPATLRHEWWSLTGAHAGRPDTQCSWCHKGSPAVFKGTTKECVGCHREDYEASTFPDHQTFPQKCAECHNTTAWKPAKHPPPPPPVPVPTTTATTTKPLPKGVKPPPPKPPTRPPPTSVPTTVPAPTSVPTARPPDVISRPSRRR
jgi:hypothetical protein